MGFSPDMPFMFGRYTYKALQGPATRRLAVEELEVDSMGLAWRRSDCAASLLEPEVSCRDGARACSWFIDRIGSYDGSDLYFHHRFFRSIEIVIT